MASASPVGHVVLWNLETRQLDCELREAHSSAVCGLSFLDNEPLLVTSSPDNSIKMWIFDCSEGEGRLLKRQEGHSAPPTKIRFHGGLGKNIVSASQDSCLRVFSTVCDQLNKSLGQASHNRKAAKRRGVKRDRQKMPPVLDFTTETTRDEEWDSIACCHQGMTAVTTWSFHKQRMGEHKLLHDRFKTDISLRNTVALCACLTVCGNFVIIGYSSGHVDRFNIQSGIWRAAYGKASTPVRGVASDALNKQVITGSGNGILSFWRFLEADLLGELQMSAGIDKVELHKESNLLGVILDNFHIVIVDCDRRKLSRKFLGHRNRVTDICFSPDCRWLLSSSMDASIRTWNIPTGQLVNWFDVEHACISLALSPTGEFLATCHVDDLGVYLWSNVSLYGHVNLTPLPESYEATVYPLPGTQFSRENDVEREENDEDDVEYCSPEQIADNLVTLSLLPNSRWLNLLKLDVIKKRNKPKEPPRKPKNAPFFLATVPGLQLQFASAQSPQESRILTSAPVQPLSDFAKMVAEAKNPEQYDCLLAHLKCEGVSAVDLDLRSLGPDSGGSLEILKNFLNFTVHMLNKNTDFECINAYLGLFLKQHYEWLIVDEDLSGMLDGVRSAVVKSWDRLEDRLQQIQCLASYMHSAIL